MAAGTRRLNGERKWHYFRLLVFAGFVVLLDQLTKTAIGNTIPLNHSVPVIPGFFDITHVHNPGGAFGLFASQSDSFRQVFFLVLILGAMVAIFCFYRTIPPTHPWLSFALALIFGGAIGNLIDRIRFGEVVDFLRFYIGRYQWPSFNIADSAISVGVGIFIIHLVLNKMPD